MSGALNLLAVETMELVVYIFLGLVIFVIVALLIYVLVSIVHTNDNTTTVTGGDGEKVNVTVNVGQMPKERVAELPIAEELKEEAAVTCAEEKTEEPAQGVVFKSERKTFEEQLALLKGDKIRLFNEILAYALSKPKTRKSDAKFYVTVKSGRLMLMQMLFQRGELVCRFMAGSSELKNYSLQEKAVRIKEKPVIIVIDTDESVGVAKNMVDIVYKNIQDARNDKTNTPPAIEK